jgi:DNA invertase Pin-like site-specific DNA recombinase
MPDYVAYYRVSTARQGQSGLGLEAQQAAVRAFVTGRGPILAEYKEVESGKKNQRPQLEAAIAQAQRVGATLLIAKLDRLSRNAGFIFALRDSKVDFVCCDMPDANTLTVGIFAVMAQHEREAISTRTKDALAARRARGLPLGTPANLTHADRLKGVQARREKAVGSLANVQAAQLAGLYRSLGWTYRKIADQLNTTGYRTVNKCEFNAPGVRRLLLPRATPAPAV